MRIILKKKEYKIKYSEDYEIFLSVTVKNDKYAAE
jgi:hypothetical protein